MEMRQVQYFRALTEELNFTRAAERNGVSQPSLTRAIRLLEQEFGGELFHRDGGKTRLSELGRIIKPHLDQIFDQAAMAKGNAQTFHDGKKTHLKLGVMCTVAPTDLVDLLVGVRAHHADIQLDVSDADGAKLDQALRDGDLEVAVVARPENSREPDLHYLPLFREQFVIVTDRDHKFGRQEKITVRDLHEEPYLRRVHCELVDLVRTVLIESGMAVKMVFRSDRDDWVLAMTAAGIGFSLMPERSVTRTDVITKPLVEPEFWREVSLVTVRGRPHSPAVGALVHEAMRAQWMSDQALAVKNLTLSRTSEDLT